MADGVGAGPAAGRPYLPGYGIAPADAGGGLLPWTRAVERLERARSYGVATRRPDGYGTGFPDPDENPVFAVRPSVVFGIIERDPDFTGRATRWRFPDHGS